MAGMMRVFVGSSSEQISIAHDVSTMLRSFGGASGEQILDVNPWDEGIFDFSAAYIESLEKELEIADFALIVMTGDDVALIRDDLRNLPRDNVIFELGLFMGRLGRERCFFLYDGDVETKITSDLSGVKTVKYFRERIDDHGGRPSLKTQAEKIFKQIKAMPVRYKPSRDVRAGQARLWHFCRQISGAWWERMRRGDDDASALSYVQIDVDHVTNTPLLRGRAFHLDGKPCATWESVASAVDLTSAKPTIFYRWSGQQSDNPGQIYGGGGRIEFDPPDLTHGSGFFYDTNYALVSVEHQKTTRIKRFGIYRSNETEQRIMRDSWTDEAAELVLLKMQTLKGI